MLISLTACFITTGLSGCGVTEPGLTSANGTGTLVISTQDVNFGKVAVGHTADATVSVSNTGSASVLLDRIQVQGADFAVTGQKSVPISVASGKSYSLALSFHPTSAGATTGALILTSNLSSDSQVIIALSGTGESDTTASPALQLQSTNVSFGDVAVNSVATQTVLLTSSGTAPITISAASVSGSEFSLADAAFPMTLPPGQTTTLDIQFDPTATGAAAGTVTLTTNTSSGTATITLSGTGASAGSYEVDLTWNAPVDSSDPVAGYDIYRAVKGSSSYQLLNSGVDDVTSYADTSVLSGTEYTYYVVSVDASGNQSAPSNVFSATIP